MRILSDYTCQDQRCPCPSQDDLECPAVLCMSKQHRLHSVQVQHRVPTASSATVPVGCHGRVGRSGLNTNLFTSESSSISHLKDNLIVYWLSKRIFETLSMAHTISKVGTFFIRIRIIFKVVITKSLDHKITFK